MTTHLAASRFGRVLQGQLRSRGLRLTEIQEMYLIPQKLPFMPKVNRELNRNEYNFRDSLKQFVLNTHLESVSHAATDQKRKTWSSGSLILLGWAQHQESKEEGKWGSK